MTEVERHADRPAPVGPRRPPALDRAPDRAAIGRRERWALAVILSVAAALRLIALGDVPPGMSQDEAIRAYDAWSLWETGADHRGRTWPAYFEAFGPGDYPAASTAWLTAPWIGLFGPKTWVWRLPIALAGIAAVALTWRWTRTNFGAATGLAAATSLAISPWHVPLCRMGYEGAITPFFVAVGLLLVIRRDGAPSRAAAVCGGAALGAAMWTYAAARAVVPLLGLVWFALNGRGQRAARDPSRGPDPTGGRNAVVLRPMARRAWIGLALGGLLGAAPMWWTLVTDSTPIFARPRQVSLLAADAPFGDVAAQFGRQYLAHFAPRNLFMPGKSDAMVFRSDYKFVHLIDAPFLVIGALVVIAAARRDARARFLVAWLLLYPLPAALSSDGGPHLIRSLMGIPILAVLVGIGVGWVAERCRALRPAARSGCAIALIVTAATTAACYASYYFNAYPSRIAPVFKPELCDAMTWLGDHRADWDVALINVPANQAYAYYLFFARVDPAIARQCDVVRRPWTRGFEHVYRFGDVWFAPPGQALSAMQIAELTREPWSGRRGVIIAATDARPAARRMVSFHRFGASLDAYAWSP